MEKTLPSAYYDLKSAVSFSSAHPLYQAAKKMHPSLTLRDVMDWLSSQEAYTLYRQVNRKITYPKTLVHGIGHQYQADLIEVHQLANWNNGIRYILTVIDVFSRKAWAVPIVKKTSAAVAEAFEVVLQDGIPRRVQTDHGKEFTGAQFQQMLTRHGIRWTHGSDVEIKCALVERFNRTLRLRLARYLEHNDTNSYLKALPHIVRAYNNSYHRSIKRKPVDVTKETESDVWITLYGEKQSGEKKRRFRYKVGDKVRICNRKGTFGRGYVEQWTGEMFEIVDRQFKIGVPVYILKAVDGEPVNSYWYELQLQKVSE